MSERSTSYRPDLIYSLPAKAESIYYRGRLLAVDTRDGRAAAAADSPYLQVLGVIRDTIDNSTGAHGDKVVVYDTPTALFDNSGTDPITQARYGRPIFVEDDITVRATPGDNNVFAGFFRGFRNTTDTRQVWVETRPLPLFAAFYGNNPDSNFRWSLDADTGAPIFQLWNQDQNTWQTVQLAGAAAAEHLIIAAA